MSERERGKRKDDEWGSHYYNNHCNYYHHYNYCYHYWNCFYGCFDRISRQASGQSVNEDPTQHVHPYSHVTGVSISKAEAVKVGALYFMLTML